MSTGVFDRSAVTGRPSLYCDKCWELKNECKCDPWKGVR